MTGGGDNFYPVVRVQRAGDAFKGAGSTTPATYEYLLTFCPFAGANPWREGASAVAGAIPVFGARLVVWGYVQSGTTIWGYDVTFDGGGAPTWRTIFQSTALTTGVFTAGIDVPAVPGMRVWLFDALSRDYEFAISIYSVV